MVIDMGNVNNNNNGNNNSLTLIRHSARSSRSSSSPSCRLWARSHAQIPASFDHVEYAMLTRLSAKAASEANESENEKFLSLSSSSFGVCVLCGFHACVTEWKPKLHDECNLSLTSSVYFPVYVVSSRSVRCCRFFHLRLFYIRLSPVAWIRAVAQIYSHLVYVTHIAQGASHREQVAA